MLALLLLGACVVLVGRGQREFDPPEVTSLSDQVAAMTEPPRAAADASVPDPAAFRPVGVPERRVSRAARYADRRGGTVSFAIVSEAGVTWSRGGHQLFHSASVVKSMLLAAELRRLAAVGVPLDDKTRKTLSSMIVVSDNDAATAIYERVGDAGLRGIAVQAGMRDFRVSGSWGYARISADDMALLFANLDQVMPPEYAPFGKRLLASIVPEQSWGIPEVARGWNARFKGGWRETPSGQLVSQAAELRRGGTRFGVAVLTDGQPSMGYGIKSVEGVAARLLDE